MAKGLVERAEKGWQLRQDRIPWLTDLADECALAGITYFYKQGGGPQPESAGHMLEGREYIRWPDGVDWRSLKAPLLERAEAAKQRAKERRHEVPEMDV